MQDPNFSFTHVGHTALYPALYQWISKDFQLVFNSCEIRKLSHLMKDTTSSHISSIYKQF